MREKKMKKCNDGLSILCVTFVVFFGLALSAIFISEKFCKHNSTLHFFVADCPFENTASPEWQSTERAYDDKCSRDAQDRVDNGSGSDRDRDAAHERELGGWS
jgi:hypothetical protein